MFDRSLFNNIMTRVDSYKFTHHLQQPPHTQVMYDYITPRGGAYPYTLFFGPQMFFPKLCEGFNKQDIDEAEEDVNLHFGRKVFNRVGWEHILNKHGGIPPLRYMVMPEGHLFPIKDKHGKHIPLVTVENTDPACFWLPGHMETSSLRGIWYPTTVATNSFDCKVEILKARMLSCDEPLVGLEYCLHDFGARGVSSAESAELGGAAHLVNFAGTDTFECLRSIRRIYHERMAGGSVPAAEHSTITSWRRGKLTNELDACDNMLIKFAKKENPGGVVAIVSDSYDLWACIQHIWGGALKQKIIESGCRIVVRPDSGNPLLVPVKAIMMLADLFGYTVNKKGYKVLPDCIRVIQGDGINRNSIREILANLLASHFSAENIVFGMGGALLQQVNRDTMEWAMKASATQDDKGWWDVYKSPVDQPNKNSLAGRFAVVNDTGLFNDYETVPLIGNEHRNLMQVGWENGKTLIDWNFSEIRKAANDAALEQAGYKAAA